MAIALIDTVLLAIIKIDMGGFAARAPLQQNADDAVGAPLMARWRGAPPRMSAHLSNPDGHFEDWWMVNSDFVGGAASTLRRLAQCTQHHQFIDVAQGGVG